MAEVKNEIFSQFTKDRENRLDSRQSQFVSAIDGNMKNLNNLVNHYTKTTQAAISS